MSNKSQTMVQKLVCLSPNFPSQEILCGLDEGWLVELVVPVLVPACRIGLLEARLPKYHISTARAKRSGASAWASAHALSIVTWYNQNIVNSYHLIMFTHLFKAESAINDFILRSESSQNYLFFLIPKGINKLISKGIKEQAGAQMGQAQLKLGLGFTPTNLHH